MIGSSISHYKILEKLGEGGMGVVYKAQDTKLDRIVALKFLPTSVGGNEETRLRFLHEARSAAALNHPNIATIHAIEEVDRKKFLVLEYIEGRELRDVIKSRADSPLTHDEVLKYARQIGEGLAAAHKKGIVHRDVKSNNIMITADDHLKIMDFGLAKVVGGTHITRIGTTVGTAPYMSPEQIQGLDVDPRSDIWSFGVILYELISGKLPFGDTYEQAVFYSILNEKPLDLPQPADKQTAHIRTVIDKCLIKDRDLRYQSMSEVLSDLSGKAGAPPQATDLPKQVLQSLKRYPKASIAATGLLLVLAFLLLFPKLSSTLKIPFLSGVPSEQHLVVLPFMNIGGDENGQPFCDGLIETMTSKLTQLEQFHGSLWVVPASEVRRSKTQSPGEAFQLFGANLVVSGSLQLQSDTYRLTMNLIDAKNLRQLNSSVIDIKSANILALQDESISRLFEMLNLQLEPKARNLIAAGATDVPGAYQLYLRGLGNLQRYENIANLDAAISDFESAIDLDSTYALAFAGLGESYWRKFEASKDNQLVPQALQNCEKAYALDYKLPEVNVALGLIQLGTGHKDKAIETFLRALIGNPTSDAAHRGLAKAYEAAQQFDKAEATHRRAIQLKPNYWAGYNDLGVFYFRNGRYEEAITQFQQVLKLTPDNDRGYSNLGGIFYMLERWPEARSMFEQALALRKTYRVCSNLGTLYYIEGQFANAARMYETALEINDKDYRVWGNLASAYSWTPNQKQKAREAYTRALKVAEAGLVLNPNNPELMSDIAGYYAMLGETERAKAMLEKTISVGQPSMQVAYRLSTAYEQLGKRDKALHWIGEALALGYSLSEIQHQPELKQLLADDRFARLLTKLPQKTTQKK